MIVNQPHTFYIEIKNSQIKNWIRCNDQKIIPKLYKPLTGSNYKIYVLVDNAKILYVGTTKMNIKNRLRSGLLANGKNGYHGYKWKKHSNLKILIWNFENLDKVQIENIEAELAFLTRLETKQWPLLQNEIHFNNKFPDGQKFAKEIYNHIKSNG